jgi:hypothetical protein
MKAEVDGAGKRSLYREYKKKLNRYEFALNISSFSIQFLMYNNNNNYNIFDFYSAHIQKFKALYK